MLEKSRRFNRLFKRPYYRYFYCDNGMKVGEQIVTKNGKDIPKWGITGYPRPTRPDQILLTVDNLESWVMVNVRNFELSSSIMPEWKKEGKGYIPHLNRETNKVEMVEVTADAFVRHWQHFDPSNIISFVESKVVQLFLKGKEDKWEKLMPYVVILGALVIIGLVIMQVMK